MSLAEPQRASTLPAPRPVRPKFNSMLTSDRLREGSLIRTQSFMTTGKVKKNRKSVFRELGLDDDLSDASSFSQSVSSAQSPVMGAQRDSIYSDLSESPSKMSPPQWTTLGLGEGKKLDDDKLYVEEPENILPGGDALASGTWHSMITGSASSRPKVDVPATVPASAFSILNRFSVLLLIIAAVLPGYGFLAATARKTALQEARVDTSVPLR